jgi:pantetheine-phosphate adenylyltransferase
MTSQEFSFLSATVVRDLAMFGGNLDDVVPTHVAKALRAKF